MKHPLFKLILSLLLAVILSSVLFLAFTTASGLTGFERERQNASVKLDGITMNTKNIISTHNRLIENYSYQLAADASLVCVALQDEVRVSGDNAIKAYENGFVVKKQGDTFVLPKDVQNIPLMTAIDHYPDAPILIHKSEPLDGESGLFWSRFADDTEGNYVLCVFVRLYEDYYFVSYTPASEIDAYFKTRMDVQKLIDATQEVYGGLIIGVNEKDGSFYAASNEFKDYHNVNELGVEIEGSRPDQYRDIVIDGVKYEYAVSDSFTVEGSNEPLRVVFLLPHNDYVMKTVEGSLVLAAIATAILIVVIVWMVSVIQLMRRNSISETRRRQYAPGRVRAVMLSIGAASTALILLISIFIGALGSVYYRSTDCENALLTMETMVEDNHSNQKNIDNQRESLYLSYAKRISQLLSDYPNLRTKDNLSAMSWIIGADYLMLFDDYGNETVTSSNFVNLKLGTDESSGTYDFRRLLTGVSGIVHEACVDEQTGLNRQLIGVCMDGDDPTNGYEALIVAIMPSGGNEAMSDSTIMQNITTSKSLAFSVDRSTGVILHSSKSSDVGAQVTDLGLSEDDIRSAFMDFFKFDNALWYGRSREFGGAIHYYAVAVEDMFGNTMTNGLINAVIFVVIYLITALVLLFGYTEKSLEKYGGTVVKDGVWFYERMEEAVNSERVRKFMDRIKNWWKNKAPGGRAIWMVELLLGFALIYLFSQVVVSSGGDYRNGEMAIISFVLSGRWTPGINLFAITKIIILLLGALLFALVMRAVVGILNGMLRTRGKTICQLVSHILNYLICLLMIYLTFKTLGFNTTTLIATVGSLSLAISMASKDIIADILAGVILVFSGEYQIGEIVEIGGFRGWVCNIGVRSTTLVNDDGSLKNINNRNVSNVVNLSRRDSSVAIQVFLDYNTSLEQVEEMLARELPDVAKAIPKIVSGPVYDGVTSMARGAMTLTISAECHEADRYAVGAAMNKEIKLMFDRNNIPMRDR